MNSFTKKSLGVAGVIVGGMIGIMVTIGQPSTSQEVSIWQKIGQSIYTTPRNLTLEFGTNKANVGTTTVAGLLTNDPNAIATTTTGTSATFEAADYLASQYYMVTLGGAQDTDFTFTLAASSSMTGIVNAVGERTISPFCLYNVASSTSVHAIILAAGTGIDLRYATSTSAGDAVPTIAIEEGFEGCLTFIAQPQDEQVTKVGDITAELKLYNESD